jgi:hypothetical protein
MHHHYSTFQSYENNNGREKSVSGENRDGHVTIQGNVNGQPFYYDNRPSSLALSRMTPSFRKNLPYNVSPYSNFYGGTRRRIRRRRPRQTFRSKKKQQKRKGRKSNKNGKRKSKKSRK